MLMKNDVDLFHGTYRIGIDEYKRIRIGQTLHHIEASYGI